MIVNLIRFVTFLWDRKDVGQFPGCRRCYESVGELFFFSFFLVGYVEERPW